MSVCANVSLRWQVRHVFAGTAARTMAQALIHPLDTVKTRLQVLTALIRLFLHRLCFP